jgi:hypothetical protein
MPHGVVTIMLPPTVEAEVAQSAAAAGLKLEHWVTEVVEVRLAEEKCRHRGPVPTDPLALDDLVTIQRDVRRLLEGVVGPLGPPHPQASGVFRPMLSAPVSTSSFGARPVNASARSIHSSSSPDLRTAWRFLRRRSCSPRRTRPTPSDAVRAKPSDVRHRCSCEPDDRRSARSPAACEATCAPTGRSVDGRHPELLRLDVAPSRPLDGLPPRPPPGSDHAPALETAREDETATVRRARWVSQSILLTGR